MSDDEKQPMAEQAMLIESAQRAAFAFNTLERLAKMAREMGIPGRDDDGDIVEAIRAYIEELQNELAKQRD